MSRSEWHARAELVEHAYTTYLPEGKSRESLSPHRCRHVGPVIVEPTGDVFRARCLVCNTVGPERETSERAYAVLIALSKRKGEDE